MPLRDTANVTASTFARGLKAIDNCFPAFMVHPNVSSTLTAALDPCYAQLCQTKVNCFPLSSLPTIPVAK